MKMKSLSILSIGILSLLSCENSPKTSPSKPAEQPIKEVSISTFGGMSTIRSETYTITADSVKYALVAVDSTKNISTTTANTGANWQQLVKAIDLKDFEKAKNGESRQAYDGNDTEIKIAAGQETFSKTNAESSQSWSKIRNVIADTYRKP